MFNNKKSLINASIRDLITSVIFKGLLKKMKLKFVLLLIIVVAASAFAKDKPIVSMIDFTPNSVSESETIAISNLVLSSIYNTGLVEVIDRSARQEILSEIAFSLSGCADDSCAIEIGKLLSADIMITGAVSKVGSRVSVDLKALDIEEGKIVGTVYDIYESIDIVIDEIHLIASSLVQNFTGEIVISNTLLEVEDYVPFIINCEEEGAIVQVNGEVIGKINDGKITKAVRNGSTAKVLITTEGFYDYEELVPITGKTLMDVEMDPLKEYLFQIYAGYGGGTMAIFELSYLFIPNWAFIATGVSYTYQQFIDMHELFIPARIGSYFLFDDRSFIRTSAGIKALFFTQEDIEYGIFLNTDLKVFEHFRGRLELDLFINETFDTGPFLESGILQIGMGIVYLP